jgi:hypothetical protein
MKNFIIILICTISLMGTGCKDFLEEDLRGKVLGKSVLSTQEGLESALTGAYKGLNNTWTYGFTGGNAIDIMLGADDMTCKPNPGNQLEYESFTVSDANPSTSPLYKGCYKAIQGANNIIENYQSAKGDQAQIKVIAGEAYFIRAFCYFWMVRFFKDIPLITTAKFSMDQLHISRTNPSEVYKLIEADLGQAESLLANSRRAKGRPNKGSAKAVLADVYLTEAGWPIKDHSKYALAAAKAKEVIDNHEVYGFKLMPTFAEVFENDAAKQGTEEEIFSITQNQNDGSSTNTLYGAYYLPTEMGGWDVAFAELNFYRNFPEGPRKDATFASVYKKQDGTIITDYTKLVSKHPYVKKQWLNEKDPGFYGFTSSIPIPLMRYPHVLTIYAEAKARSGGPDQLAYDYVNAIRARAGLLPLAGLSATEFADAVVQERAWEFASEYSRWFDLVRLERVAQANSHRDPSEIPIPNPITENDYTFPFPYADLLLNPNL